jgi:hypothetical protein
MKNLKFAVTLTLPLGVLAGVGLGLAQPAAADPIYVYPNGTVVQGVVQPVNQGWHRDGRHSRNQRLYPAPAQTVIATPVVVQGRDQGRDQRYETNQRPVVVADPGQNPVLINRYPADQRRSGEALERHRYPVTAYPESGNRYPGRYDTDDQRSEHHRYKSHQRPVLVYPARPVSRQVWIAGHYEPGFLGLGRKWVEGHWETRP